MHACIRHLQVSQLAPAKYHTPELVLTDYLGCRFPVSWADFRLCLCKLCSEADRGRLAGQRREFKTYRKSTPQLIIDHLHSYTLYCVDHTSHESHDKWFDYNTTSLFRGHQTGELPFSIHATARRLPTCQKVNVNMLVNKISSWMNLWSGHPLTRPSIHSIGNFVYKHVDIYFLAGWQAKGSRVNGKRQLAGLVTPLANDKKA